MFKEKKENRSSIFWNDSASCILWERTLFCAPDPRMSIVNVIVAWRRSCRIPQKCTWREQREWGFCFCVCLNHIFFLFWSVFCLFVFSPNSMWRTVLETHHRFSFTFLFNFRNCFLFFLLCKSKYKHNKIKVYFKITHCVFSFPQVCVWPVLKEFQCFYKTFTYLKQSWAIPRCISIVMNYAALRFLISHIFSHIFSHILTFFFFKYSTETFWCWILYF